MSAVAYAGRVHQPTPVLRVRCEARGHARECRIMSLARQEAFIESFVPLAAGTEIDLSFQLPGGHTVRAQGIVRYHQFKVGFGVEFTRISKDDQNQIARLIN